MKSFDNLRSDSILKVHIACWHQNTPAVVNLLLERDVGNIIITKKVDGQEWDRCQASTRLLYEQSSKGTYESMFTSLDKLSPLHLSLLGGRDTVEITRLILRKIIDLKKTGGSSNTINSLDMKGRNALHIACMKRADPDIISLLLELDHENENLFKGDLRLNRPFHYACLHSAPIESVTMLLHAEEQALKSDKHNGIPEKSLSISVLNAQEKTPIDMAVRDDANIDIIQLLLEPKYFNVQNQEEYFLEKMGHLISSDPILQESLNHKMAERKNFAVIFLEAFTSFFVIFTFFFGVGRRCAKYSTVIFICLIICVCLFVIRESLQLVSQGVRYISDPFNYYNVLSISLLIASILFMDDKGDNSKGCVQCDDSKTAKAVLITCGILLIGNGIYFLRGTFLPFARFFGGLVCMEPRAKSLK